MTDERRCAMGILCLDFKVIAGRREPALLTTPAGLCDTCQRWARYCVRELPSDWCKLKASIGERRTPIGDNTRRPKPGPRIPLNITSDALMSDMVTTAHEAAEVVAVALNVTRTRGHLRGHSSRQDYRLLTACTALIADNIPKLITDDDGLRLAQRMIKLHRKVVRHLGETMQREKQHLPCPFCGGVVIKEVRDLRGRSWSSNRDTGIETPEIIRCTSCDNGPNQDGTWTEAEYRWLSTQVLSEREEINMLKWLLAEAQWERDSHAWLAAEREWALLNIARVMGIEGGAAALVEAVRSSA